MSEALQSIKDAENKAEQIVKDAYETARREAVAADKRNSDKGAQMIAEVEKEGKSKLEDARNQGKKIEGEILDNNRVQCEGIVSDASQRIDECAQKVFERLVK